MRTNSPSPYWSHLEKTNRAHPQPGLRSSCPAPRLQQSVLIPATPNLAADRNSSAPRIGDVSPVAPAALPPVVMIQTTQRPTPRPGCLDLSA